MARKSLPPAHSQAQSRLSLADVNIVLEADDGRTRKTVEGASVAALLDVAGDSEGLLDPEAIALGVERVADLLATLAEGQRAPRDGALYAAEECLRQLAARIDGLRPQAARLAEHYTIRPRRSEDTVREHFAPYRAALAFSEAGYREAAAVVLQSTTVALLGG